MTDILFHVGPDKTGTTSIQRFCHRHSRLLRRHGIEYPTVLGDHNHRWLTAAFLSDKDKLPVLKGCPVFRMWRNKLQAKKAVVEAVSRPGISLVALSHEGVHSLSPDDLGRLRRFLSKLAQRVMLLYFARDPFTYAKSAMSQRVLAGRCPTEPKLPVQNHKDILSNYISEFGRESVKVHVYGPNAIRDFLGYLGAANTTLSRLASSDAHDNSALTATAMQVGVHLRELLADAGLQPKSFGKVFGARLRGIEGPPLELTPQQIDEVWESAQDSLDFLYREFGARLPVPTRVAGTIDHDQRDAKRIAASLFKQYADSTAAEPA